MTVAYAVIKFRNSSIQSRTHNWLLVVTRNRSHVSTGDGVTNRVIIQGSIDSHSERGAGERITGGKI